MKLGFITLILTVSLSACGGGGGNGGSADTFLGGIYTALLLQTLNTCGVNVDPSISVTWTVNQDEERIVMDASTGATYSGAPTGPDSFRVSSTRIDNDGCVTNTTVFFTDITRSASGVSFDITSECPVGRFTIGCTLTYAGPASRKLS